MCPRHVPGLELPASQHTCWLCSDPRPEKISNLPEKKIVKEIPSVTCAWKGCLNTPTSKSKYCSRQCSNKNARKRYNERKIN